MWDDSQQRQLDDLQRRAQCSDLANEDQAALDRLLDELEHHEWAQLQAGLARLRLEQRHLLSDLSDLKPENAMLTTLADRYADLLARGQLQLDALVRERAALRATFGRLGH
jgi:hypothetical protein